MKKLTTCSITILALIGGSMWFLKDRPEQADILATVDDTAITEVAFHSWWKRQQPEEDTDHNRREVLDQLIERTALANRARAAGLDRDPQIVEAIESLLIARLREVELQPRLSELAVSEEEIRTKYEESSSSFINEPSKRLAVLWFNTRGQEPLAARYRPRLQTVRDEAASSTENFGQIALRNSEHRASRHHGGEIGWIEDRPGLDPWRNAVITIAQDLKEPGELSDVTTTPQGIFLVKLLEERASMQRPLAEVRDKIIADLKREKRQKLEEDFASLTAEVVVHENELQALAPLPVLESEDTQSTPFPTLSKY